MTQRGQWSVISSTTSSPIRSSRATLALHELGVIVVGTHDDVGSEAPDFEAALRVELS